MLHISVIENYINGWRTDIENDDGKMLVFANTTTVKEGVIEVVDKLISKCPELRMDALEAMYDCISQDEDI
jgi:hypothetical protein